MLSNDAFPRLVAALAILSLAGCGSYQAPTMPNTPAVAPGSNIGKTGCQPDFTLTLSPASATITSGQSVRIAVQFASVCGLAGNINFGIHAISPQPQGGNGFTIHQPRYDIPLDANGTAVGYITLGATPSTLKTKWTITIQGKNVQGGCCYGLTHSATFLLTVD